MFNHVWLSDDGKMMWDGFDSSDGAVGCSTSWTAAISSIIHSLLLRNCIITTFGYASIPVVPVISSSSWITCKSLEKLYRQAGRQAQKDIRLTADNHVHTGHDRLHHMSYFATPCRHYIYSAENTHCTSNTFRICIKWTDMLCAISCISVWCLGNWLCLCGQ